MKHSNIASSILASLGLFILGAGFLAGCVFISQIPLAVTVWFYALVAFALLYGFSEVIRLLQGIHDALLPPSSESVDAMAMKIDPSEDDHSALGGDPQPGHFVIKAYTEPYLDHPNVDVFIDEAYVDKIKFKETLELKLRDECDLQIVVLARKKTYHYVPGKCRGLQVSMFGRRLSLTEIN